MAISAAAEWFYRTDGSDANGGGWDPSISGAGTNYADLGVPTYSWDGFATSLSTAGAGATTVTSSNNIFNPGVIGNALRLTAGTNFVAGWYFVTGWISSTQIVVDRSPSPSAAGSLGAAVIGGAGRLPSNNVFPVQPGNTIWIRGSGSDDGVTVDYDFSAGYWTGIFTPSGVGHWVRVRGYNGRPHIQGPGLTIYQPGQVIFDHVKVSTKTSGTSNESFGIVNGNDVVFEDCILETNGVDISALVLQCTAIRSEIRNTGSPVGSLANSYPLIRLDQTVHCHVIECEVYGSRADGISQSYYTMTILRSIVRGHAGHGITISGGSGAGNRQLLYYNDVYGNGGDGLHLVDSDHGDAVVRGNIFSGNGGYGLNCSVSGRHAFDWNAFYGNSSGAYSSADLAGPNDLTLTGDPYTNAAGRVFTLNTTAGAGAVLRQLVSQIGAQ